MFGCFRQLVIVSLVAERGLLRAVGAINLSLRWSEGALSKFHLKLESTVCYFGKWDRRVRYIVTRTRQSLRGSHHEAVTI
jgi:hypothetical protein